MSHYPEWSKAQAVDFFRAIFNGFGGCDDVLKRVKKQDIGWTAILNEYDLAGGLSSWDFDVLTRAVFVAHDRGARLSVEPAGPTKLRLRVTPRHRPPGDMALVHPTLEQAVAKWRAEPDGTWHRRLQAEAMPACPVRAQACPEHRFVHGREAEELRKGVEDLLAAPPSDWDRALQNLLDSVDARDSLAFLESHDKDSV